MLRFSVSALIGAKVVPLDALRTERIKEVSALAEFQQATAFQSSLLDGSVSSPQNLAAAKSFKPLLAEFPWVTRTSILTSLDAALMTFLLHVEARIASLLGHGFYTIGPCGEENLAPIGLVLDTKDPMALHYRHVAVSVARQLREGRTLEEIALQRARGYVVSRHDPVTGGVHCAIGGGAYDYVVTSTLASQTCPAVGRAIVGGFAKSLGVSTPFTGDYVSFVSVGDGSVCNGHFLSGDNFAELARFRGNRVPLVLCVSDNGISISTKNRGYLRSHFLKKLQMPIFMGRGCDMADTWECSYNAIQHARKWKEPVALVLHDITRRFGHAATDRQFAYLTAEEIKNMAESNPLASACAHAIDAGAITAQGLASRFDTMWSTVRQAFETAHSEPKLTDRADLVRRTSPRLVAMPGTSQYDSEQPQAAIMSHVKLGRVGTAGAKSNVMRKHMTAVFDESLAKRPNLVYMGEDVIHGGYYLVTDGLAKKYPKRLLDFPPDETSIMGVAMGFSQGGLLPIVEMPYAKYLDCAMDMFCEACVMGWLSNGKQTNGMVVRLQGFGRGVFGGNFHTHNSLHMPPGIDVVCHSNGPDYAKAMRYALHQAAHGRLTMFVDCTDILNQRRTVTIHGENSSWEFPLTEESEYTTFDDVTLYVASTTANKTPNTTQPKGVIITYGDGVLSALEAQSRLLSAFQTAFDVVDCPLLSRVPTGLTNILREKKYSHVVFADICKEGQHPLASHMCHLYNEGVFAGTQRVRCIAALPTYNPLGSRLPFLSTNDIVSAATENQPAAA